MNRDLFARWMQASIESGDGSMPDDFDPDGPADDGNPFGTPEAELTHAVDVSAYVDQKRAVDHEPCQPGDRHRHVPGDARGDLPPRRSAPSGSSRRAHPQGCTKDGCSNDPAVPRPSRPGSCRVEHRCRSRTRPDRAGTGRGAWPSSWPPPARCTSSRARCAGAARRRRRWPLLWDRPIAIEPRMAEIPSPEGVADGRPGRVAARGDARARGPTSACATRRSATRSVPRCVRAPPTRWCSATSSRSTPRSAWRWATIGW